MTNQHQISKSSSDVRAPEEVTASLEGARVLVENGVCELEEYDFATNSWILKEQREWPLSGNLAQQWLQGWNAVDRFKAFSMLISNEPERSTGSSVLLAEIIR